MNKVEFMNQVKIIDTKNVISEPSPSEYAAIECVYTWHPSIDPTKGKEQIAYLYVNFGMALINDMMNTAYAAMTAEQEMLEAKQKYDQAKDRYEKLRKHGYQSNYLSEQ